jgi:hypothetical protein
VPVSPVAVDRPRRRPPRFHVLQVVYVGDPPKVSVIAGASFDDLIAAWHVAGHLRTRYSNLIFVAGEMCSTE